MACSRLARFALPRVAHSGPQGNPLVMRWHDEQRA
jgi:hypothetical protein